MKHTIIIVLIFLVATCKPDNSLDNEMNRLVDTLNIDHEISSDSLMNKVMDYFNLPGLAVAICNSDSILSINYTGYSNTISKKKLTPNDCFDLNSVTKSTTALLIASLVNDGKISYRSTMSDIFPEIKDKIHSDFKNVTIEDFLHHESGLSRNGRHVEQNKRPDFKGDYKNKRYQFATWILQYPATEDFGEYNYSNAGYVILSAVIEKLTDQSWEDEISDKLILPLGLTSASFGWPPNSSKQYTIGHMRVANGEFIQRESYDNWYLYGISNPMGGLNLSINDFAKYASFQLKGLKGQTDFLPIERFEEMHRISVLHGHGWFASEFTEYSGSVHDGSDDGYFSKIFISKELDLGIVVLTNIDDENAWKACNLITYVKLWRYTNTY